MLKRSPLSRLLLLCAFFSVISVADVWASSAFGGQLQLALSDPALVAADWQQNGMDDTLSRDGDCWLEYSMSDLRPDDKASRHTSISSPSVKFLIKRYCQKIGISPHLTAGFDSFSRITRKVDNLDDVLAGGLIGIASSYVFAEPYMGWRIKAEGGIGNVSFNFKHAW